MNFAKQLRYLLWKNFLLRKHQKCGTFLEVFLPLCIFAILGLVRLSNVIEKHPECHYPAKGLPSAGFLPFLQSYICTIQNTCHQKPFDDDDIGRVNDDNYSLLNEIGVLVQKFLNASDGTEDLSKFVGGIARLITMYPTLKDLGLTGLIPVLGESLSSDSNSSAEILTGIRDYTGDDILAMFTCGESTKNLERISPPKVADVRLRDRFRGDTGAVTATPRPITMIEDLFSSADNVTVSVICDTFEATDLDGKCLAWLNTMELLPKGLIPQAFTLLRGFILVSPDSEATRKIVEKMERWMQGFGWLKDSFVDFYLNAELYQDALSNSTLGWIFRDCLKLLRSCSKPKCRELLPTFEKLNGFFVNSTDVNATLPQWKRLLGPLSGLMECFLADRFRFAASEHEMESRAMCLSDMNKFFGGLHFNVSRNASDLPEMMAYKIRMPGTLVHGPGIRDRIWNPRPRDNPFIDLKYLVYGFSFLQDAVDRAIIELHTNETQMAGVYMQQFPSPCYQLNGFARAIAGLFPLLMIFTFLHTAQLLIKNIVYEKEVRLKEFMKIMGLSNLVHWTAWFLQSFLISFVLLILLITLLKVGQIIEGTDFIILLLFLSLFMVATIAQCFLLAAFFEKANLAAVAGAVLYLLLYIPFVPIVQNASEMSYSEKMASCLSAQIAFGWGCSFIAGWEGLQVGVNWANINDPVLDNSLTLLDSMLMLMADTVVYLILAWYIEAVYPGQYGVPRPFYFFLTKSYWCGSKDDTSEVRSSDPSPEIKKYTEPEPTHLPLGIAVRDLKKTFPNGRVGLSGVSVNFYESQITSFLGHNGAGKTTTMSIIAGMITPTKGTAIVYGHDVRSRVDEIRKSLGMCPQHNILYDTLTVREQLKFYAGLKGVPPGQIDKEVNGLIEELGLTPKADTQAQHLSGGTRRRLSVAAAFIGGAKAVILDEPTSGVDPYARRQIWDLLLRKKEGRTIILSTHFMDEADVLGDRIAIIGQGQLKCCGSSMFLKRCYGADYRLTMVRKNPVTIGRGQLLLGKMDSRPRSPSSRPLSPSSPPLAASRSCPTLPAIEGQQLDQRISQFIRTYLSDAVLDEDRGHEFTYNVATHNPELLYKFFVELEKKLNEFDISSYGVSEAKLEQIFLEIAGEEGTAEGMPGGWTSRFPCLRFKFGGCKKKCKKGQLPIDDVNLMDTTDDEADRQPDTGLVPSSHEIYGQSSLVKITMQQLYALLSKRYNNFRRNTKGAFCEIVFPLVLIALTLLLFGLPPPRKASDSGTVIMVPWYYGPPNYVFQSLDDPSPDVNSVGRKYMDALNEYPGMGIRCAKDQPFNDSIPCEPFSQWTPIEATTIAMDRRPKNVCACDEESTYVCPRGSYQPPPRVTLTNTTDFMVDMTGHNITRWLLMTEEEYREKRYGGYSFGELNTAALENLNWPVIDRNIQEIRSLFGELSRVAGIDWKTGRRIPMSQLHVANSTFLSVMNATEKLKVLLHGLEIRSNVKIWFNNQGWISGPAYASVFSNAVLRAHLAKDKDKSAYGIIVANHPMNQSIRTQADRIVTGNIGRAMSEATMIMFTLCIIPASFVLFIIGENVVFAKHLQLVSGVKPILYWLSNYIWDMVNFLIPALGTMMLFLIFNEKAYIGTAKAGLATFSLLVLYGFGVIPMMYPFTFYFRIPSRAFFSLSMGSAFIGWITTLTTLILELLTNLNPDLADVNDVLMIVFLIFPQYCLGRGLLDIKAGYFFYMREAFLRGSAATHVDPFKWTVIGRNLFCLFVSGCIWFMVVLLIEYRLHLARLCCRHRSQSAVITSGTEDEDVKRERAVIDSLENTTGYALVVKNLTKVFKLGCCGLCGPPFKAVDNLCVGVKEGECFGLLGLNGAGKTTVFSVLTGKLRVTSGDALMGNTSILSDLGRVRRQIGFCPQFDALHPLLTGREELRLYAQLRGIKPALVERIVSRSIRELGLKQYADVQTGTYSGGNKRKLSAAIAMIGCPSVIMLDEPTTGMDPRARRFVWNRIIEILKDGKTSVILTSHSMEECEVLCHRIGIMVNGRFRCLGSTQHLKSRFGHGYTLTIKIGGTKPRTDEVVDYMNNRFPGMTVKEQHLSQVRLQLPSATRSLSEVFLCIVEAVKIFPIEDYSLTQTTLDDVFLSFAGEQLTEVTKR